MPKNDRRKPPAEQLTLNFAGFDPRQRPLFPSPLRPVDPELVVEQLADLARCGCLEPGDIGERYETIGALMPEAIWEAEHGT